MTYASNLSQFVNAKISAIIIDSQISAAANAGRVPQPAIDIAHALGFELPAKPAALILALNAAEDAKPFNSKKGHSLLLELFAMAQAIADSGKVKNLPALTLPEWATDEARAEAAEQKAAKKAEKKTESKNEKTEAPAPSVTIVTLETVKNQVSSLSDDEKQELLAFIAESLGYEMAIS